MAKYPVVTVKDAGGRTFKCYKRGATLLDKELADLCARPLDKMFDEEDEREGVRPARRSK